jgi:hypothetical protein
MSYPGTNTKLVGYEYTNYYAAEEPASPSDTAPASAAPAAPCESTPCENSACGNSACDNRPCCCKPSPCDNLHTFLHNGFRRRCSTGGEPGGYSPPYTALPWQQEDDWAPVHLFENNCFLKKHSIDVGGWMAAGYVANPQSPSDKFNGPVTWMDRSNEGMLNELWLYAGHAANNDGEGLALGWRVDLLYGESARLTTSAGLEDHINKSQSFMGLAIPNLYIDAAYNDLKMKIGHFISPVGYYTVGTYQNFFNTIPYTYQWGEPFTHTGILPAYQATDNLVVGAGLIRGWDNSSNFNPHAGYVGTATYSNLMKEGDALAFVQFYSEEPDGAATGVGPSVNPIYAAGKPQFAGRYFQSLVYSRPLSDKWTYVAQSDFGYQSNAVTANQVTQNANGIASTNSGKSRWYGINQYLYYKHNNQWSWGANFEWFRDEEGFRVGGFLPNYPNDTNGGPSNTRGWGSSGATGVFAGGFAGSFYQMTFGPRWTPMPNLVIRPNARFDWYAGPNGTGLYAHPYDAGRRTNQGLLMTDLILVF